MIKVHRDRFHHSARETPRVFGQRRRSIDANERAIEGERDGTKEKDARIIVIELGFDFAAIGGHGALENAGLVVSARRGLERRASERAAGC